MRLLLTGGSGQVGSALRAMAPDSIEINAPPSRHLDIAQPESVVAAVTALRPNVVVNAAAYTAVDAAEDDAERAWRVNAEGPGHLAAACATVGARLIQLSTDYVFDGNKTSPYVESDATHPLGVYGASKLGGEAAALAALPETLVLRVSWVFSEVGTNFVKVILKRAANGGPLRVVDDQWGTPCAAAAIAATLYRCIARMQTDEPLSGLYHFASAPVTNRWAFACEIVAAARAAGIIRQELPIERIPTAAISTRAVRPRYSVLDGQRLWRALGVDTPDWRGDLRDVVARLSAEESRGSAAT